MADSLPPLKSNPLVLLPQKCSTFVVGINFDLMKRTYIAFVLMCMYMLVTKEVSSSLLVLLVACCQCAELVSCKLRETTNQRLFYKFSGVACHRDKDTD